eukprot:g17849.t1
MVFELQGGRTGWSRAARPVMCVETGQVYKSLTEAARATNASPGNLYKAIEMGWKSRGFTWIYVPVDSAPSPAAETPTEEASQILIRTSRSLRLNAYFKRYAQAHLWKYLCIMRFLTLNTPGICTFLSVYIIDVLSSYWTFRLSYELREIRTCRKQPRKWRDGLTPGLI